MHVPLLPVPQLGFHSLPPRKAPGKSLVALQPDGCSASLSHKHSWLFPSERCFPALGNEPCLVCSPWPFLSSISTFTQALHIIAAKLGLQSVLFAIFRISMESSVSLWLSLHLGAGDSSPCGFHAATNALLESQTTCPKLCGFF